MKKLFLNFVLKFFVIFACCIAFCIFFINFGFSQSICHSSCVSGVSGVSDVCFAPDLDLLIIEDCCFPPFRGDEDPKDGYIHTFGSVTINTGINITLCQRSNALMCESPDVCTPVNEARGNLHIQAVTSFVNAGTIHLEEKGEGRFPVWMRSDTDVLGVINSPNFMGRSLISTITSRSFTMLKIYANTLLNYASTNPNRFFSFIRNDFSDFETFLTPSPTNSSVTLRFEVFNSSFYRVYSDDMLISANISLSDPLHSISRLNVTSGLTSRTLPVATDLGSGIDGLPGVGCRNIRTTLNLGLSQCSDIGGKSGGIGGNAGGFFYVQTPVFNNREGVISVDGEMGSDSSLNSDLIINGNGRDLDGDTFIGNSYNYVNVENQGGRGSNGSSGFAFIKARRILPGISVNIIYGCISNNCQNDLVSDLSRMPTLNPSIFFDRILNLDQILSFDKNPLYLFSIAEIGYQFLNPASVLSYRYFPISSVAYRFSQQGVVTDENFLCLQMTTVNCQISNNLLSGRTYNSKTQKMNWFFSSKEIQTMLYSSSPFPLFSLDDGVAIKLELLLNSLGETTPSSVSNFSFHVDQYAPCDHVSDVCEINIYDFHSVKKNFQNFSAETSRIATINDIHFSFDIFVLDQNVFSTIEILPKEHNIRLLVLRQLNKQLYTVSNADTIIEFEGFSLSFADMNCNYLLSPSAPWGNIDTVDISYGSNSPPYSTEDTEGPGPKMASLTKRLLAKSCSLPNNQPCDGEIWLFACLKDQANNWSRLISTEQSGGRYSSSILSRLPVVSNNYNIRESLSQLAAFSYPLEAIFSGSVPPNTITFDQFSSDSEVVNLNGEYSLKSFTKVVFDFVHDVDDVVCSQDPCQVLDILDNDIVEKIVFSREFYNDFTSIVVGLRLPSDFSGIQNVWYHINSSEPNTPVTSREDLQVLLGAKRAEYNSVLCNIEMLVRFRSQVNFCFEIGTGNFDNQFLYIWLEDSAGNINSIYNVRRRLPVDTIPPFEPIIECKSETSSRCESSTVPFSFLSINQNDLFSEDLYIISADATSAIWAYKICFWRYNSNNDKFLSDEEIEENILSNNGECPKLDSFLEMGISLSTSRTWCILNPFSPNLLPLTRFPLLCQSIEDSFCENNRFNKVAVCYLDGGKWQYTIIAVDTAENRSPIKVSTVLTVNFDLLEFSTVNQAPYQNSITSSSISWQREKVYDFIDGEYSFSIRYRPNSHRFCELSGLPQIWIDLDGSCIDEVTSGDSLKECVTDSERFLMSHMDGDIACAEDIFKSFSEISLLGNFTSPSFRLNYNRESKGRMYYLFVIDDFIVSDIFSIEFLPYNTTDFKGNMQVRNNLYQPGLKFPVILIKTEMPTDRIRLKILDSNGHHIRWIYQDVEYQTVSFYPTWDLKNDGGEDVSSGLYYAFLMIVESNGNVQKEHLPIILIR